MKPWETTRVVGKPLPRVDGYARVTGSATYTLDVNLPRMLHTAIVRSPHAHARIKGVDVTEAAKMPGVRAILTTNDGEAKIPWYFNWVLKKTVSQLLDPHCRFEGEEVAAVAAETPQQAWDAARAIRIEYEVLPHVVDVEEAMKPEAPPVHEGGNRMAPPEQSGRGDVQKGFAAADAVAEGSYRTSCQIHTPTEVHGSVAMWERNRLTVWDSTQGVFGSQPYLAQIFGLPLSDVRVIGHYMGGGFGSKLGLDKSTVIAAVLARRTGRPVKAALPREHTFLAVGNRPPNVIKVKIGAKKDGTLTAIDYWNAGAVGAYPEGAGTGFQALELYTCPNVRVEEHDVFTNTGPARAFRAPGFPQCSWALEQTMDALAEKLGMDPVELRLKNIPLVSQTDGNKPYSSTGLAECLRKGAEEFGWKARRTHVGEDGRVVRGMGVAASLWGYAGGPPATAILKLFPDGSAHLNMGAADLGTGTKTVMSMIVAEELGIPVEKVSLEYADTGTTQYTDPSGGSKTVVSDGPAVRNAAADVKTKLLQMASVQLNVPVLELSLQDGAVLGGAKPLPLGEVAELAAQHVVIGVGTREPNSPDTVTRPFAANFAEVEVNTATGEVKVLRLLGAHDSGRPMNLLTYRNQVFGGMVMAQGLSMTERRILDPRSGKMVNARWQDYKLPTAKDAPDEQICVPIDPHDESNNLGAKGLGEPATIATAAAIANAFYNATGARITAMPINVPQVVELLEQRRKRG